MSTMHQLVSRYKRKSKIIRPLVPALKKCPQKRGVVQKVFIQTPKKPNSAKRKVAKVKLSTGRIISCYIPGEETKLTKHSVVLVRGGRAQDLIGVRYKPIFGKFDLTPPEDRISRRSKFGLSNKNRKTNDSEGNKTDNLKKANVSVDLKISSSNDTKKMRISSSIFSNISKYLVGRVNLNDNEPSN